MIDRIQEHLEAIYGIRCELRASDFLVDTEAALRLGGTGRSGEELLVSEGAEDVELALYLSPALLERVSRYGEPRKALEGDLGSFCEVTEGVSHFVYLARSVNLERHVSLLELEAQAEVDKFAICTLLRWGGGVTRWAGSMVERLFHRVSYRASLSETERHRYVEANRLGRSYAAKLLPFIRAGHIDQFLGELRRSYRMGAGAKLAYFGAR